MAIFSRNKSINKSAGKKELAVVSTTKKPSIQRDISGVIIRPRITEKAGILSEKNHVYTFEIANTATKGQVSKAIKTLYKVSPLKVRIIRLPEKRVFVRGKFGTQAGVKKALISLKKGETIQFS
jgi:large subunit ribosomal protein L23